MMRIALILAAVAVLGVGGYLLFRPSPEAAICTSDETLSAPSGRDLTLCEVVYEVQPDNSAWAVIRVTDPDLPAAGVEMVTNDHDWACETWGLPALEKEPRPVRIVVQIMEAPFVRGEPAPGIRQRIEAYSEDAGACLWELL